MEGIHVPFKRKTDQSIQSSSRKWYHHHRYYLLALMLKEFYRVQRAVRQGDVKARQETTRLTGKATSTSQYDKRAAKVYG